LLNYKLRKRKIFKKLTIIYHIMLNSQFIVGFLLGAGLVGMISGSYLCFIGRNYILYEKSNNVCLDCCHNENAKVD
jgi:hypothetical protein